MRKRAAKKWTNKGLELPARFLRRVTEEYYRRHGRMPSSAAGSSSAAWLTSNAVLLHVKRQWTELLHRVRLAASNSSILAAAASPQIPSF